MISAQPTLFLYVCIFLLIPFVCGYILKKYRIPPVIGYIIGGLLLGNTLGDISTNGYINQFAYFGILLLMFTIGLEIHIEKLLMLKKFIILGGILQILLSTVCIFVISVIFHFTPLQSLLIGMAFSSSSTMLVAKIIQDRGEESSLLGELAIGLLMFQDLAFIPFAIVFTFLNTSSGTAVELAAHIIGGMAKALLVIMVMSQFGKRAVSLLFDAVARTSRELLNLFIIVFIFLVAYISTQLDIPILIGMFIAGILVAQTSEHHHIFSQIRPIRDVLSIIFFVYIGSHIQLVALAGSLPSVFLFSVSIMTVKAFIILILFLYFKFNSRLAFSLSTFLFQVSESAFILISLARMNNIITQQEYLFVIAVVLLSLLITPLVVNNKDVLYAGIRSFLKAYVPVFDRYIKYQIDFRPTSIDTLEMKNHVVICGYGRVGAYIGRALLLSGIPFLAIDYNFHTVKKAKSEGINIIYGDPTDIDILDFAQTEHATALVSVVPERFSQEAIILNAKKLNPQIILISRIHNHDHQMRLKDLGVDIVVQPELEASLSIIKRLLVIKNLPREDILRKLRHFKVEQGIHS